MPLDTTAIGVERRWTLGFSAARNDEASLRLFEVVPTEVRDGDCITVNCTPLGRVIAVGNFGNVRFASCPCLFGVSTP